MEDTKEKPGVATTEFWLAFAVAVCGATASVYAETDLGRALAIVSAALASAGYGFARATTKRGS